MRKFFVLAATALLVVASVSFANAAPTNSSGGPLTDRTFQSYTSPAGVASRYHIYAAGLDWSKPVGMLIYTDGSGEYGLKNLSTRYLLAGKNGMIDVAKRNNMLLLTPLAPGVGCPDGKGTCWYETSSNLTPAQKARWSYELVRHVQNQYNIDNTRVAFGGYSSGAQWTTEYFGPAHASQIMTDGVAVAISYGGSPKVKPQFTAGHKAKVPYVWDTGDSDTAYKTTGRYGVKAGYRWYTNNGFQTERHIVAGLGHSRSGQFGAIMDREIKQHVAPSSGVRPRRSIRRTSNATCYHRTRVYPTRPSRLIFDVS